MVGSDLLSYCGDQLGEGPAPNLLLLSSRLLPGSADGTCGDLSAGARVDCAHCSAVGWSTMALLSTFKVGLPAARALDVALLLDVSVQFHTKPEQLFPHRL